MNDFQAKLDQFLRTMDGTVQPDWRTMPLESSILLAPWGNTDEELRADAQMTMRAIAHELLDAFHMRIQEALKKIDSPIERRLFLVLWLVGRHLDALSSGVRVLGESTPIDFARIGYDWPHLSIIPQHQIHSHRVDFYLEFAQEFQPRHACRIPQPRCAVSTVILECDGHDFHDRTKEQASRDRERDRDLQKEGYSVLRYTGSDIYRDPFHCATDAFDFLVRRVREEQRTFDKKFPCDMDDYLD